VTDRNGQDQKAELIEGSEGKYTYTYKVGTSNDLVAVFAPNVGGTFRLTVTGSKFTVNNGTQQRQRLDDLFDANAPITLKYTGSEQFLYWVNSSGKILSTNPEYTFTLVMNTAVQAVTSDANTGSEALVVFVSSRSNGQVLNQRYYSNTETIVFPAGPSTLGKTFSGWSMTEEEIHNAMATKSQIVVYPEYESSDEKYTVIVKYVDQNGVEFASESTYSGSIGKSQSLTAEETIDSKTFQYWSDKAIDGSKLSYSTSYAVRPSTTATLTYYAVYGTGEAVAVPVVYMSDAFTSMNGAKYVVSFTASRSIPDGYTFQKAGILYGRAENIGTTVDAVKAAMTITNISDNVKDSPFNSTLANDTGTANIRTAVANRVFIARGYIIVQKGNETQTIYSDNAIYGSYDSGFTTISGLNG
jgi:hypothetical protein